MIRFLCNVKINFFPGFQKSKNLIVAGIFHCKLSLFCVLCGVPGGVCYQDFGGPYRELHLLELIRTFFSIQILFSLANGNLSVLLAYDNVFIHMYFSRTCIKTLSRTPNNQDTVSSLLSKPASKEKQN